MSYEPTKEDVEAVRLFSTFFKIPVDVALLNRDASNLTDKQRTDYIGELLEAVMVALKKDDTLFTPDIAAVFAPLMPEINEWLEKRKAI